jgi:xylulokinase
MYAELLELWHDLYGNLCEDMARHNALLHRFSEPPAVAVSGAGTGS